MSGTKRPDYGIDAPAVRRGMLGAGIVGALIGGLAAAMATYATGAVSTAAAWIAGACDFEMIELR